MVADIETKQYELTEKTIAINRTSKVVEGGRIFSFSAVVVVGNGKGKVGFGIGKSDEVPVAVQKATDQAKKSMIQVDLKGTTLQHAIVGKHGASRILLKPASPGTGIIAGAAVRSVMEQVGVNNILTKRQGSKNTMNLVHATISALFNLKDAVAIANKRGVSLKRVFN